MIDRFARYVIPDALALLPGKMDTPAARAMCISIALQETQLQHRVQMAGGPAKSIYQFELGGVCGVMQHPASRDFLRKVLDRLCYSPDIAPQVLHEAIEHNDTLATVLARLNLYTYPAPLHDKTDPAGAWQQYLHVWRPGKPHEETWADNYAQAWAAVERV